MKIEIITIGDEILIGQITDTNSAWMARELTQRGFDIRAVTSVGDCPDDIIRALDIAFSRADILLLTGGVGPTNDDLTKQTLCRYFGTPLIFSEEVLKQNESLFQRRKIPLNLLTRNQAYVPEAATVIPNSTGTAPFLWFGKGDKVLVSMPGVPTEMKTAMREEIIPRLEKQFRVKTYLRRMYMVTGMNESALAGHLAFFEDNLPAGFSLAYLPSGGYIRLRLSAKGEEHAAEMARQGTVLKQLLASSCISESDQKPEELLGEILREKGLMLSTAESCTGGFIAHLITTVPGASAYYKGSVVSYDNQIKEKMLRVKKETIEQVGAVSREVVEQMALHVAEEMDTTCALAVSGIMGPDGGSEEKPVGTVWIATLCGRELLSQEYHVGRGREQNIERTANLAIVQLINMMQRDPV